MSFETQFPDFIAEIKYLSTDEGGRSTPIKSGYRPHIKFPFSKMMTSAQQKFINQDIVNPGETVNAEIMILSPNFFKHMLKVGMEFKVGEGSKIVANGKLIKILNSDLIKS